MARKPRMHYEGALYHVITRGNNRDYIFRQEQNKMQYLEKLFKYVKQYDGRLYAYVIMDNHCHLLIEARTTPISKIMQLVQQTYTGWYNRTYKHSGHVFEQRFKSILVDKDEYLLALVRYIHQNPVRAGIGDLDYLYSSHGYYRRYDSFVCEVGEVLSYFGKSKKKAVTEYLDFVSKPDETIRAISEGELAPDQDEVAIELSKQSFEKRDRVAIIQAFEEKHQLESEDLKGKYLGSVLTEKRNQLIVELVKYRAMTQAEISRSYGLSTCYVSMICGKDKSRHGPG